MPTPIGHAVGGVAAGCLVAAVTGYCRRYSARGNLSTDKLEGFSSFQEFWALALVGMLADIDLVFGAHRGATHSVGAILVVGVAATLFVKQQKIRVGFVVAAAYASHVIFDWLGSDPGPPFGVMALWPLTHEFYLSDVQVFFRVCREYWLVECWRHNVAAIGRELLILTPVVIIAVWLVGIKRVIERDS